MTEREHQDHLGDSSKNSVESFRQWVRNKRLYLIGGTVLSIAAFLGIREGQAEAETVPLVAGCQIKSLVDYPPGTPLSKITDQIGEGANPRLWFLKAGSVDFQLFDPNSFERSDKTELGFSDEAGFVCVDAPTVWEREPVDIELTPTQTQRPEPTATKTSSPSPTSTPRPSDTPTPIPTSTPLPTNTLTPTSTPFSQLETCNSGKFINPVDGQEVPTSVDVRVELAHNENWEDGCSAPSGEQFIPEVTLIDTYGNQFDWAIYCLNSITEPYNYNDVSACWRDGVILADFSGRQWGMEIKINDEVVEHISVVIE